MISKFDVMKSITPTSPLLTLVVEPKDGTATKNLLAQFHPIMKSLGYGRFELNDEGFYQASKYVKAGILGNERFVFAEIHEDSVIINMDGHSIF